jgi:hypothetical protein
MCAPITPASTATETTAKTPLFICGLPPGVRVICTSESWLVPNLLQDSTPDSLASGHEPDLSTRRGPEIQFSPNGTADNRTAKTHRLLPAVSPSKRIVESTASWPLFPRARSQAPKQRKSREAWSPPFAPGYPHCRADLAEAKPALGPSLSNIDHAQGERRRALQISRATGPSTRVADQPMARVVDEPPVPEFCSRTG